MTRAEAEAIYDLGKEAVVKILLEMDARIRRLEERLGMDSTNSSKPPSTDNKLTKSPPQKSTDKKTKRGGQKGHKGSTLLQSDTPDFTEVIKPTACSKCQSSLKESLVCKITKRQVFDIPKANINVKEYQGHSIVCSCCHHKNHATFPNGINAPTQYGKNLSAFIAYLHSYQMVPYERITQLIDDLYSHKLSTGTIITMLQKTYDATQESEIHTKALLKRSPLLHCDETGVSVEGRLHWIHGASTSHLTYFLLHKRRGQTATDAMGILPTYRGIVMSDHWAVYKNYTLSSHSFCNAHHLRELQGISDNEKVQWSKDMHALLIRANNAVLKAKSHAQTALTPSKIAQFTHQYDTITNTAMGYYPTPPPTPTKQRGRIKQPKGKNLLDRFKRYKTETLRFLNDFTVPFTNNQAERDLRMIKVKEKISGTIASKRGGEYFARIRGYISTVKKQGAKILEELFNALDGKPFLPQLAGGC